jgi:hypothetical protein
VILDRSVEGHGAPRLAAAGLPMLRRLTVGLPAPAELELGRFEALAALVEGTPVGHLRAGADVPAATLARHLVAALPEARSR